MSTPEISTLRYVFLRDLAPNAEDIYEHDIKLTIGEGVSLYTGQQTLNEIDKHHKVRDRLTKLNTASSAAGLRPIYAGVEQSSNEDFTDLINAVKALPDDVLIEW